MQDLGLHLKFLMDIRSLSPKLPTIRSRVLKNVPHFSPRAVVRGTQAVTLHPLQIWLHPLGICIIKSNTLIWISVMKPTWWTFHSIYWESKASICFEHYLLILRSHSQLTLYACNIPSAVCAAPPEDEQVTLETCTGPWFSINWMKSALRWFHYTDILWRTVSKTLSNSDLKWAQ
jgi:hypothetical protein